MTAWSCPRYPDGSDGTPTAGACGGFGNRAEMRSLVDDSTGSTGKSDRSGSNDSRTCSKSRWCRGGPPSAPCATWPATAWWRDSATAPTARAGAAGSPTSRALPPSRRIGRRVLLASTRAVRPHVPGGFRRPSGRRHGPACGLSGSSTGEGVTGVVVDIGCAYGPFLDALKEHGVPGYGVEVSAAAVAYVRKKLGIPALCGSFEDAARGALPRRISAVTLWYVIEHFTGHRPRPAQGLLAPSPGRRARFLDAERPGDLRAKKRPGDSSATARRTISRFSLQRASG